MAAQSDSDHSAPQGWEDELNAAWALVNEARAERDRAIETRENANSVSVRVEAENERLAMAVKQWQGHATDAQAEGDRLRAENEALDAENGRLREAADNAMARIRVCDFGGAHKLLFEARGLDKISPAFDEREASDV